MKRFIFAVPFIAAICLLAHLPARAQNADDFETRQRAAVAQNPPGVHCALRLAAGKTRFQQGETIRVTAQFTADQPSVYSLDVLVLPRPTFFFEFGKFHVASQEGVSDPLADYPMPTGGGFSGGVPNPLPLSDKPAALTVELNRWLRFDRPGHYRVYATTRGRVREKGKLQGGFGGGEPQGGFSGGGLAVASGIIELDIGPTDPAWAQAQVQAQQANLANDRIVYDPPRAEPQELPEGDVRWLNTPAAARAIIERMGRNETPNRIPDENVLTWQPALIGYPDRQWLIEEMERALARPDYAVTQTFLETMALLMAMQREPHPPALIKAHADLPVDVATLPRELDKADADWRTRFSHAKEAALASCWKIAVQSVDAKAGTPRAKTLHSLLALAWSDLDLKGDPAITKSLPTLAGQMALVLDQFSERQSRTLEVLLRYQWDDLENDAAPEVLLATLLRLWDKQQPRPLGTGFEPHNSILRHIYELSPEQGRALILKEIASPRPRANLETLGLLPDATLPELDDVLLANLTLKTGDRDYETTMRLVERYATPKILPQLQALYGDTIKGSACGYAPILAYFLRVAPDYGMNRIAAAMAARQDNGCYKFLLSGLAHLEMTPALERMAIAHLDDPEAEVVRDAAQMLQKHGGAAARDALLARLKRTDDAPLTRPGLESAVVTALTEAPSWILDAQQVQAILASCRTDAGRRIVNAFLKRRMEASFAQAR